MPAVAWWLISALGGALGWAYFTKSDGEAETVLERLTTNLGVAALFAGGAVAAVWFWRKRMR